MTMNNFIIGIELSLKSNLTCMQVREKVYSEIRDSELRSANIVSINVDYND